MASDLTPLKTLARSQHSVFSHGQAVKLGINPREIAAFVRATGFACVLPGTYAHPKRDSPEQRLTAALIWAGPSAVLSHRSAGALRGWWGVPQGVLEVTVPRSQRPRGRRVLVHRADLRKGDVEKYKGFPCTSVVRTLIDLAGVLDEDNLAMAVEHAFAHDFGLPDIVESQLGFLHARGRTGLASLQEILGDCRRRPRRALESPLEVRFWRWIQQTDLPRPTPGVQWEDGRGQPCRFDFAYPDQRLAIEIDSFAHHGQRETFEADCIRHSRIAGIHWRLIRVTSRQLDDPESLRTRILNGIRAQPPKKEPRWLRQLLDA